jgi:hypothetical protein
MLEMVAIVAGGASNFIEIYSPNGGCSRSLATAPLSNNVPIFGVINGILTYCSSYYDNRYNFYYKFS